MDTPIKTSKLRRVRKIVRTGDDRQTNHRADFKHCPSCDYAMESEKWDAAGVILILEPGCYKAGCITVLSECPKCFELSWIHQRMNGFGWNDTWPTDWKEAVKKQETLVKLKALREWGAGICYSCQHLTDGSIEYHAWRYCIKGSGPPETTCDKYVSLTENASKSKKKYKN